MKSPKPGCCGVSCKLPEKMPDRTLALYGAAFLEFGAFVFFGVTMLGAIHVTGVELNPAATPHPTNVLFLSLAGIIGTISSLMVVLAACLLAKQYGLRALCLALIQPALMVVIMRGNRPGWFNVVLLWSSLVPVVVSVLYGYFRAWVSKNEERNHPTGE